MRARATKPVSDDAEIAQTLDRGLLVLEALGMGGPMTVAELAEELSLSRPIVHRLANTLLRRKFVGRGQDGRLVIGSALLRLSRSAGAALRDASRPHLEDLSQRFDATAILVVAEGSEAVCVESVEPTGPHVRLAYPPGFRHPIHLTASGMAILASRPPTKGERKEIAEARRAGFAVSSSDLQRIPGIGVAVAIAAPGELADASIALASLDHELDVKAVATALRRAALAIAEELG